MNAAGPADDDENDPPKRGARGGGREPVSSKTRARVRQLAREGMGRNAISRETGVPHATVSRLCASARPPILFDRAATKAAVSAKMTDLKARRAVLSEGMLDDADEIRRRLFEERTVRTTDGQGTVISYTVEPQARDWKDALTAVGIAIDKHLVLVRHDSDDRDLPAVDAWLAHLGVQ